MTQAVLSGRERVRLALAHQATDRIPIAMICSGINEPARGEFDAYLQQHCGKDLATFLDEVLDVKGIQPEYIGPPRAPGVDIWGVKRTSVSFGAGEYREISEYPLANAESVDDLARHRWPDPAWFDYAGLPAQIAAARAKGDCALVVGNGNPFETTWYMRGFERIFEDMILNPELVRAIMRRVTDFHLAFFRRILAAADGGIDLVFTADDIAGQDGLLMSPAMLREHIIPYHAELNRAIHEFDVKILYHSDGAVASAVPELIESGIDILQALQFDAKGMDPAALKRDFGDRLCFEGGVSVQKTLPFGTPDDVRAEVKHLIDTLGQGGGYILGPAHVIQAGTPPENIHAMFETALNYYPHGG